MSFWGIREELVSIKKDLASMNHSIKTLRNNTDDLYQIIYKDSDSMLNRLNIIKARLDTVVEDYEKISDKIEKNTEDVNSLLEFSKDNKNVISNIKAKIKSGEEHRSKFYYALLIPILIAILPTVINFFTISETESEVDRLFNKLDEISREQERRERLLDRLDNE